MDTTSLPPDDRPPVPAARRANRGLLWASAVAVVVLAVATIVAFTAGDGGSGDDAQVQPAEGAATADAGLVGTDVTGDALPAVSYETFDGRTVDLDTGGRPLVLNFWAAYCAPCINEMPALEQAYLANADRVGFLGLQVLEKAERGQAMIERTGVTYPTGRDAKGEVLQSLGGLNLPRTVLVAADGTIVAVHNGEISETELQALIDEKLAG